MQQENYRHNPEVRALFKRQIFDISVKVDRAFAYLMAIQWALAIILAISVSPNTWIGQSGPQEYLLVAFVFGGLFSLTPVYCVLAFPGRAVTRYMIGAGQLCFSTLLIYLTGGRIETHFHIFVSMALLAFYQDVLLISAVGVLAVFDHILRGYFLPISIYGISAGVEWRWLEHAAWIVFEGVVVNFGIRRVRGEIFEMVLSKYQLIQAKEEAVHAMAMKSQFLSNMSHEIRTPLNSIIGFSEVLKDTKLDKEQSYYIDTIHRCSDSLLHIINDILDISKIENGVMQVDRHRFDLQEFHKDLHKMFSVHCRDKGLELSVVMEEEVPQHAIGDSYRIKQVLMNLTSNAIKFTQQGQIMIKLRRLEKHLQWEVSDTGMGIRQESLPHLFKRYVQADSSVSRKFGGTGLGLVISKNLVELMGGVIGVESQLGQGTTFTFKIPIEET